MELMCITIFSGVILSLNSVCIGAGVNMAHRSQCSSAGDNPLDPNYLPPSLPWGVPIGSWCPGWSWLGGLQWVSSGSRCCWFLIPFRDWVYQNHGARSTSHCPTREEIHGWRCRWLFWHLLAGTFRPWCSEPGLRLATAIRICWTHWGHYIGEPVWPQDAQYQGASPQNDQECTTSEFACCSSAVIRYY